MSAASAPRISVAYWAEIDRWDLFTLLNEETSKLNLMEGIVPELSQGIC